MAYLTAIVVSNSAEAIKQILSVYLPDGGLIADVTWGNGVFWKSINEKYRIVGSDLEGKKGSHLIADFTALPYRASTFDAVFLDPPWGNQGGGRDYADTYNEGIREQYGLHTRKTGEELLEQYASGLLECKRAMKADGLLVVKGQDFILSGRKTWITKFILDTAYENGLCALDQLVQVQSRHPQMRHKGPQHHFRSNHSFYWIFKKDIPKIRRL